MALPKKPLGLLALAWVAAAAAGADDGPHSFARWGPDGYSYPGVVKEIKGGKYRIHYDDGDKAWVEGRHVIPYLPTFGDRVEGDWLGKGKFYKGRITERKGKSVRIQYDDGDVETTTIARLRMDLSGVQLKTSE